MSYKTRWTNEFFQFPLLGGRAVGRIWEELKYPFSWKLVCFGGTSCKTLSLMEVLAELGDVTKYFVESFRLEKTHKLI